MQVVQVLRRAAAVALVAGAAAAQPVPGVWYTYGMHATRCVRTMSPADKLRELDDAEATLRFKPTVERSPDGQRVVITHDRIWDKHVWTFYRDQGQCERELPRPAPVDEDLE